MLEEQSDQLENESKPDLEGLIGEVDVDALINKAKAEIIGHTWRQRGPWLVCTSCTYKHTYWLGMNKQLVGIDEKGKPIVRVLQR